MISAGRLLIFSGVVLTGCNTVRDAAVTTFRVVDTPARYVRERIDRSEATTETAGTSDVVTPGQPVRSPSQTPEETRATTQNRETASSNRGPVSETETAATSRKPARASAAKASEYPTARPVPGKPGYVYSLDPQGGIVDVSGYASGDKAKDPYTKQIFIVP